jgi:integrase
MAELTVFRGAPVDKEPQNSGSVAHGHAQPRIDDVAGSVSPNTLRAYRADCRAWTTWAVEHGRCAMPAAESDVADHVRALAGTLKASSLTRRIAAIAWAHRANGLPFDATTPVLAFAMARIRRERGTAVEGKAPLKTDEIKAVLARLPDTTAGTRDRAIILLGFASALRRSEISALDVEDVEHERDGLVVLLRRSKGDQHGKGQLVGIRYGKRGATCPVRALQAWLKAAKIASGPLFRQMRGSVVTEARLGDQSIYHVLKRACAGAGLDAARFGAHSLRSGHVTTALANGADVLNARDQLRHKSVETTVTYDRRRQSLKRSTSGKLGL